MTLILGVNMITKQMNPFFSPSLKALSVGIFYFLFQDLQNSIPRGSPLTYVLVCKIYIYMPEIAL